jgi:predicted dehydrogenase
MSIRIGIIGTGRIATHVHLKQLSECGGAQITALCDIDPAALNAVGDQYHVPAERRFARYQDLIACPEVDAVEICTPNYLHTRMALAAIAAGKPFNLEKPLGICREDAKALEQAIRNRSVPSMMCFSYRFFPATRYAKWILDQGYLGTILSVHVSYLKESHIRAGRKLEWRFIKEYAGAGVLCDLGVHLIDMTRLLAGDFEKVCCDTEIIVKEREKLDGSGMGKCETDDVCTFLARLENNATAAFYINGCARGHDNTITYDLYGTEGALSFDLDHPEKLGISCARLDPEHVGMHMVEVPERFFARQEQTFLDAVNGKQGDYYPSILEGVRTQNTLDALVESSEKHVWVRVEKTE